MLGFSMPPELTLTDVPTLATVTIPGVELCRVGVWNGHRYSRAYLEAAVQNWQQLRGRFDVPLTLGHDGESRLGDGDPSIGWIDNVRLDGDSLLGDYVKVPPKVAALIKAGAYAKRSCTFLEGPTIDGQARQGLVLQNVALLGGRTPAVDGLEDVVALYNARRLAASGGTSRTLTTATGGERMNPVLLARLPADVRTAFASWRAAHVTVQQLISGPAQSDIQSAVEKALAAQYPPAQGDTDDAPGQDGPSCNILDWFISGQDMSVIVSDQDVDNLWEIPFTYDSGQDTASIGTPVAVKGTYTPSGTSAESGEPAGEEPDEPPAGGVSPAGGTAEQMARRLAAQVADTAVENLLTEAEAEFDKLLAGVNAIAAGKPGVSEFRSILDAAKKAMGRIKVAKPASGDGGDASPPTPKPVQNRRQEEPDVKLTQLAKIYGLPETATEDEVMRAAEGAAASRGVVQTLARKVDSLLERDAEREIGTMLDTAVSEGRLKRWSKPGEEGELYGTLRKLARTDLATAQAIIAAQPKFVDTTEYGRAGSDIGAPETPVTPGVAAELRKLGRDPDKISTESLGDRWKRERQAHQAERAQKLGLPARR